MMAYLMWRVMVGLNREITMSFLLVGHTKFAPDWCFGLFKRVHKRTKITCLDDIARVAETSAFVNHSQLVGDLDGNSIVPFYNWSNFFEETTTKTALKGISHMQHFRFTAAFPGYVFVKDSNADKERKIKIVKDITWKPTLATLPDEIPPPGLTLERQWYLYNKIREFCPDNTKDIVCPLPQTPLD